MSTFNLLSKSNQLSSVIRNHRFILRYHVTIKKPLANNYPICYNGIRFSQTSARPPNQNNDQSKSGREDAYEERKKYTVNFKRQSIGEEFKRFSIKYGPLFVICHATVGATTFGCLYFLTSFVADPITNIPTSIVMQASEYLNIKFVEKGGRFMVAYVIYKTTFIPRVVISCMLTQVLAPRFNQLKWMKRLSREGDKSRS